MMVHRRNAGSDPTGVSPPRRGFTAIPLDPERGDDGFRHVVAQRRQAQYVLVLVAVVILGGAVLRALGAFGDDEQLSPTPSGGSKPAGALPLSAPGSGPRGATQSAPGRWNLSWNTIRQFTLNGEVVQLHCGSVHYFRLMPNAWEITLLNAKAGGLNCIETYVPWNWHEPVQGQFRWSGILSIELFLKTCSQLKVMVILRPGPYICSEWDLGGLPSWLLRESDMILRSNHPRYLDAARSYLEALSKEIMPFLGDPIVAIQLENEFFSAQARGTIHHPKALLDVYHKLGLTRVPIVMSDNNFSRVPKEILDLGPGPEHSPRRPYVLQTTNFDYAVTQRLDELRAFQPESPLMVMEFWAGWFDHWGEKHHGRDALNTSESVTRFVNRPTSFNIYMYAGGTNFAFMNGANQEPNYMPTTTSYDYDAPIREWGALTPKYWEIRKRLNSSVPVPQMPTHMLPLEIGTVQMDTFVPLFDILDVVSTTPDGIYFDEPRTMEALGQNFGFVLYTHVWDDPKANPGGVLRLSAIHDRAQVFVDGVPDGRIPERGQNDDEPHEVRIRAGAQIVRVLVENLGRTNYGTTPDKIHDRKGMMGGVTFNGKPLLGWRHHLIELRESHRLLPELDGRRFLKAAKERAIPMANTTGEFMRPTFFFGQFDKGGKAGFSFMDVSGKGVAWVNGFNLGRFWSARGPQKSLHVPDAVMEAGTNYVTVLQLHPDEKSRTIRLHSGGVF